MIKFDLPPLFQPVSKKNFDPPTSSLNPPHLKKYFNPPTSFWTIRTLNIRTQQVEVHSYAFFGTNMNVWSMICQERTMRLKVGKTPLTPWFPWHTRRRADWLVSSSSNSTPQP